MIRDISWVRDYKILSSRNDEGLVKLVQDSVNAGWCPVGGVAIAPGFHPGSMMFYQAVVKYESEIEA